MSAGAKEIAAYVFAGHSYSEAARKFGRSRSAVAGIVYRASQEPRPTITPYSLVELPDDDDDWANRAVAGSANLLAAILRTRAAHREAAS